MYDYVDRICCIHSLLLRVSRVLNVFNSRAYNFIPCSSSSCVVFRIRIKNPKNKKWFRNWTGFFLRTFTLQRKSNGIGCHANSTVAAAHSINPLFALAVTAFPPKYFHSPSMRWVSTKSIRRVHTAQAGECEKPKMMWISSFFIQFFFTEIRIFRYSIVLYKIQHKKNYVVKIYY